MFSTFQTRIVLLLYTLLQGFLGLTGLRLNKISIPAYKLRGESAFLECQYELDRTTYVSTNTNSRQHEPNQDVSSDGGEGGGGSYNYIDTVSMTAGGWESSIYHGAQTANAQQQKQRQRSQHQQPPQRQPYRYFNTGKGPEAGRRQPGLYQTQQQRTQASQEAAARRRIYWQDSVAGASRRLSTSFYGGGGGTGGDIAEDDDRDVSRSSVDSDDDGNGDGDGDGDDDDGEGVGEALYAVKWYKDNEEFYRYVPKANPPKQSYRVDGIRVIEEHSDSTRVLLRGLTLNSSGWYRCEVSAEAPNFSSVQGEGRMDIVYLPRDGPHIKGQQFQYQLGEMLHLNCTSGKSHPASHLQWFINEQPVAHTQFLVPYNDTVHKHGLITSTVGLRLTVDATHFLNGAMKVKCLASISPVLWKGGKESVLQRRPGVIDNREAMLLVRSRASDLYSPQFQHILVTSAVTLSLFVLSHLLLTRQARS